MNKLPSKTKYSRKTRNSTLKCAKRTKRLQKISLPNNIAQMQLQNGGAEHINRVSKEIIARAKQRKQKILASKPPHGANNQPNSLMPGGVNQELINQIIKFTMVMPRIKSNSNASNA